MARETMMGAYGRPGTEFRLAQVIVAVLMLASAVLLRSWGLTPLALWQVAQAASWRWAPPMHLNELGIKRDLRKRVLWTQVVEVREPTRWRQGFQSTTARRSTCPRRWLTTFPSTADWPASTT